MVEEICHQATAGKVMTVNVFPKSHEKPNFVSEYGDNFLISL